MASKLSVALALLSRAQAQDVSGKTLVNDQKFIDLLNSVEGSTWLAGPSDFFAEMTFDDARPLLGTALNPDSDDVHPALEESMYSIKDSDIPEAFDATSHFGSLVKPIRNQLQCGSCWAFSAAEVLSDRFAIATNKSSSPVLSPEDMVSCDKEDMGCGGGMLHLAWQYLTDTGIVTDACFPYTAGQGKPVAKCETQCVDSETFTKYKVKKAYTMTTVANMQKDIMTYGPIQVAFMVYRSFMTYKSGVYHRGFWEFLPEGGHAVKIVGWGKESGTPYWLVANSWGTTWGLQGYFKIVRGKDACGIESSGPPYAGIPDTDAGSFVI